jgi:hypothetical protein
MKRSAFVFVGVVVGAFLAASTGCSSSSGSGGAGGMAGTGGGATTSSSGTGGMAGTGGMMAVSLDCTSYCTEVMADCTGANEQYKDMAGCMGVCASFPAGTIADMSGDTLGCRLYHGGVPSKTMPDMHCSHAGPLGGPGDPATAGPCGDSCEAFCNAAVKVCPAAWTDAAACKTDCATFAKDATPYSTADTGKNDIGCRMYHLSVASSSTANAMTHCPHIVKASATCTM